MVDNQLTEAPSTGAYYSSDNKGIGGDKISSIIDKAIVNCAWISLYAEVVIQYLPVGVSNYTLLLFTLDSSHYEGGGGPFRFLNFLADQEGFIEVAESLGVYLL